MKNQTQIHTYLHHKFYRNLQDLKLNVNINPIIIAISGGQDSICLIKLLQDFKKYLKPLLKIEYIYIDHQWKNDSIYQVKHLSNFIKNMHEKIYVYQIKHITTSEKHARKLRYQLIIKHSIKYKKVTIMTAHTETDKIETFWLQIMRGTGINGATSLNKQIILDNGIQFLRPLINFKRADLYWFCRQFCLPIWSDITNYTYHINRNRLRNELIPYIKQYFQNNIEQQIQKFLDICQIDNEYIKQNAIKLYLMSRHSKNIALNYTLIKKQHIALQKRTLQIFFYHNLNIILYHDILNQLIRFIKEDMNTHNNTITIKRINLIIYRNWIYIS